MPRGLPRPICPVQRKPVPYNVDLYDDGTPHFSCTNEHRVQLTEHYHLCQVCGKKLYLNAVFFIDAEIGTIIDRAGLHQRCARLALAHCPFLQNPKIGQWSMGPHTAVMAVYANVRETMTVDESDDRLLLPIWKEAPAHMREAICGETPEFRKENDDGNTPMA